MTDPLPGAANGELRLPVLYVPPNLLLRLYCAHVARTRALAARERLSFFLASVNTVLARYEHQFEVLRRELLALQQMIREQHYGNGMAPDQEGRVFRNVTELNGTFGSLRQADTHLYECRRYFRSLAQVHHPDKGGDLDFFQALRLARDQADLDFLRVQFVLTFRGTDLTWQSTEAEAFWIEQEQKATVNKTRLTALPIFKVVAAHASGRKQEATQLMEEELRYRVLALHKELEHARMRARGEHLSVEPVFVPGSGVNY